MFIQRDLAPQLLAFSQFFPVVALLGPRQSGKTTLAQALFPAYHYLNLENLDQRAVALADPRGFLEKLLAHPGVIIDEFQQAPELLSYLQVLVDREQRPGFFILTGSHNFLMNQAIMQSLAGRVGILTLLPLSNQELLAANLQADFSETAILKGCYPRVFAENALAPHFIYPSYIQTYLERDVRALINLTDLTVFKKFLGFCAARVGQLLNVASLAADVGINVSTAQAWLALLEASYIIFRLQPYHRNFNKRLIKSSKLYFYDTGLACTLLMIDTDAQLEQHYLRGALFENLIVADIFKQFYNRAKTPPVYFWRDNHGQEVDCLIEQANQLLPIEIKAGMTFQTSWLTGLQNWLNLAAVKQGLIVYGGRERLELSQVIIQSWRDFKI